MKLLQLVALIVLIASPLLSAMEKKQEEREWVYENARLGKFLSQTHPKVVDWLQKMYVNVPVTRLDGHKWRIYSVAWNSEGSKLASCCWSGLICIWDAKTGRCLRKIEKGGMNSISWCPHEDKIVAGSCDRFARIFDANNGECLHTLKGQRGQWGGISFVAWSPDGKRIAQTTGKMIYVWKIQHKDKYILGILSPAGVYRRGELIGHAGNVESVAWNKTSQELVSGSMNDGIILWDVVREEILRKVHFCTFSPCHVAWSVADKIASGIGQENIIIYDAQWETSKTLTGHTNNVTTMAWQPGINHLASGSNDKTIRIFNVKTRSCLRTIECQHEIGTLAWNNDGSKLASHDGNEVCIWDFTAERTLDDVLECLSIAHINFLVALHEIQGRNHRAIIRPGTQSFITYQSLPVCIRDLLEKSGCVCLIK